ncbi:diacylglycerol kinase family protein [Ruminococcus sp. NK3A76]|uniref:diacylglycerol/lipid kinase family protein n=1 Tax=Ruminococcus sp. NK3A76 TaxID=877411 RepID=UPI00056D1BCB|nr:diacylglycerol kinase family protein [Ruminococcus sp. NK3A76]
MKKLLFVFNPHAGKGMIRSNLCDIIDIFTKHGYEVTAYPTQAPLDGYQKIASDAALYDVVVTSGGDGTLSEAVKGLMHYKQKIPLGYIPAGSTNDFAASMSLNRKMKDAAEEIMQGVFFDYDVGDFNGNKFVYVAAFGAFTDVSYQTPQWSKNILGHAAYLFEGLRRLPKITGYDVRVEHDGEVIEGKFVYGMVSNTISVGGMKKLIADGVCYDDGLFEITLIKMPSNPIELSNTLTEAMLDKFNENSIVTFKTSKVTFTSNDEIAWTLDGEAGGAFRHVEINNIKQAVRFLVKPDSKTAEQDALLGRVKNTVQEKPELGWDNLFEDQMDIDE